MISRLTADVDFTNWSRQAGRFVTMLGMDQREVMVRQTGLLIGDLVAHTPPRDLGVLGRKIEGDIAKVIAPMPAIPLPSAQRQGAGEGGFVWLAAGSEWLTGVLEEDYQPGAGVAQLRPLVYKKDPVKKYTPLGRRGKQHVQRLNRVIARRGVIRDLGRSLMARGGRMKAAWCVGSTTENFRVRLPAWVSRHLDSAPGDYIDGLGTPKKPTFTIINRAIGIYRMVPLVSAALERRAHAMKKDLQLYLEGTKKKAGFK